MESKGRRTGERSDEGVCGCGSGALTKGQGDRQLKQAYG